MTRKILDLVDGSTGKPNRLDPSENALLFPTTVETAHKFRWYLMGNLDHIEDVRDDVRDEIYYET